MVAPVLKKKFTVAKFDHRTVAKIDQLFLLTPSPALFSPPARWPKSRKIRQQAIVVRLSLSWPKTALANVGKCKVLDRLCRKSRPDMCVDIASV
jgi:hypothetical protein